MIFWLRILVLAAGMMVSCAVSAAPGPTSISLGRSVVRLDGPWKFHTGDSPAWSQPAFNDRDWERVDLTPKPGSNDGDVGLSGFVPGWSMSGHRGYYGYAWYRIHLLVNAPHGSELTLLGPWAVDSAYQVFVNGTSVGGVGDFSGAAPVAYGYHYPTLFRLPSGSEHGGSLVIAIRTWMGPWGARVPGAGGIHIAPAIGEWSAVVDRYHLQWLKIFEGYVVDAIPAALFAWMALMVLCMWPFDPADRAYPWMAVALLLSAAERGNHAFFFWFRIETVRDLAWFAFVLLGPLLLVTWIMAWRRWFKAAWPAWLSAAVFLTALLLMLAQIAVRPWLLGTTYPPFAAPVIHVLIHCMRLILLGAFAVTIWQGTWRRGVDGVLGFASAVAIGVVLFAPELAVLHVPGIWFPWGVGLSLSECASVVFDVLLAALLTRRLWTHARLVRRLRVVKGEARLPST